MNDSAKIERVARAICQERCAFYGEPPCYKLDEWKPGDDCDEPGCRAMAMAAVAAMQDAP